MFRATIARRLASLSPAQYINLALAALLWSYTLLRAARLSFTHDESVTFLIALKVEYSAIATYDLPIPSNNHMLNSVLAKLCKELISTHAFALRLPNVLAHAAYLAAALRLAGRAGSGFTSVLAFLILTLNPFLLDFFSLCRGYGLACCFELLALLLLLQSAEDARIRPARSFYALLLAALSTLANLSFLVFFLALTGILALIEITKWARAAREPGSERPARRPSAALLASLLLGLLVALSLCAWAVPIGLTMRELGELYYGGDRGFLEDTLGSLLEASTYYLPYAPWLRYVLPGVGILLMAVALLLSARRAAQGRFSAAWLCALPLLTTLICVVQHRAMETKFPIDRTALFFIPMSALALVVAASAAAHSGLRHALLGGVALLLVVNGAHALNLRYFAQWQYDASSNKMLSKLAKERGRQRVLLAANWLFEPSLNYYREHRRLRWLQRVTRGSLGEDADYYYYLPEDEPLMAQRKLQPLRHSEVSGATLARLLR